MMSAENTLILSIGVFFLAVPNNHNIHKARVECARCALRFRLPSPFCSFAHTQTPTRRHRQNCNSIAVFALMNVRFFVLFFTISVNISKSLSLFVSRLHWHRLVACFSRSYTTYCFSIYFLTADACSYIYLS